MLLPFIAGLTDTDTNIQHICLELSKLSSASKVSILRFENQSVSFSIKVSTFSAQISFFYVSLYVENSSSFLVSEYIWHSIDRACMNM